MQGVPGAHVEKCQIFGFQGIASLRPCGFLRTGRSATSCLLSSLLVPGGGSASRWGQFISAAPRLFPKASSCANLWLSCLQDLSASVCRALLMMPTLLHPSAECGTSLPERGACKLRCPQQSDSVILDCQRAGCQNLFFKSWGSRNN